MKNQKQIWAGKKEIDFVLCAVASPTVQFE